LSYAPTKCSLPRSKNRARRILAVIVNPSYCSCFQQENLPDISLQCLLRLRQRRAQSRKQKQPAGL